MHQFWKVKLEYFRLDYNTYLKWCKIRLLPTEMSSHLCTICQALDIRQLLIASRDQKSSQIKTRLTGLLDADLEWKTGIPDFFKHQGSFEALENAAKLGCALCNLIWQCCPEDIRQSGGEKGVDINKQSQLFIGSSSFNVSKGEIPVITVSQRPPGKSPRALCSFDVFAERGMLTFDIDLDWANNTRRSTTSQGI